MHKFEELLPEEFHAEKEKNPVIYCAFGPMEYHGCHNSLDIDPGKAYEICLRAVEITGGIVFPMIPVAPGGSMKVEKMFDREQLRKIAPQAYPTVCTSVNICKELYYELFETFAEDLGFKVCVAFGGHGPAQTLIKKICDDHGSEIKGMKMVPAGSTSHIRDVVEAENSKRGVKRLAHAGLWETAMNMATNPEHVNLEKLNEPWPEIFERYPDDIIHGNTLATVKLGKLFLQTAAERIASKVEKLLKSE